MPLSRNREAGIGKAKASPASGLLRARARSRRLVGVLAQHGGHARQAVGPDLTQVFVGSEGTLGVITGARLRAWPVPSAQRRAAFGFDTFAAGADACRRIVQRGLSPAALRLYDAVEADRFWVFTHPDTVAMTAIKSEYALAGEPPADPFRGPGAAAEPPAAPQAVASPRAPEPTEEPSR